MRKREVKNGDIFSSFVVLKEVEQKNKKRHFLCKCECGEERVCSLSNLVAKRVKTCKACKAKKNKTHGMSKTKEYHAWEAIIQRCNNANHQSFKDYGGRGIKVCERWIKFENFFEDMGYSNGLTIDRIDNDRNYEPSNCRWVNQSIQSFNTRIRKDNITGTTGVYYIKSRNMWESYISVLNIKKKKLFKTKEEAVECRKKWEYEAIMIIESLNA